MEPSKDSQPVIKDKTDIDVRKRVVSKLGRRGVFKGIVGTAALSILAPAGSRLPLTTEKPIKPPIPTPTSPPAISLTDTANQQSIAEPAVVSTPLPAINQVTPITESSLQLTPTAEPSPQPSPQPASKAEQPDSLSKEADDFNNSYSSEQKKQFASLVQNQIDKIRNPLNILFLRRTLSWHNKIEETLNNSEKILGYQFNPELRKYLLGLIFTESRGDSSAKSTVGDVGLCQLQLPTAKEIAKGLKKLPLHIPKSTDDKSWENYLKEYPQENALLAIKYLDDLYDYFGDAGIALWTYHRGHGSMINYIGACFKRPDFSAEAILKDAKKAEEFVRFIKDKKPNFADLRFSEEVNRVLNEEKLSEESKDYVPTIIAAQTEINKLTEPYVRS